MKAFWICDLRCWIGPTTIAFLVVGVLAAPLAANAQQLAKVARIGVLTTGTPSTHGRVLDAFSQGLRELGYVEGRNMVVEHRWAEGKPDRLPDLAAEVVRLKVQVIMTGGIPAVRALK